MTADTQEGARTALARVMEHMTDGGNTFPAGTVLGGHSYDDWAAWYRRGAQSILAALQADPDAARAVVALLGGEGRHRHRYGLVPVWTKDGSAVDSWWWCTDHPAGEWVKIEDEPDGPIAPPPPASRDAIRAAIAILEHTSDYHATDARLTLVAALAFAAPQDDREAEIARWIDSLHEDANGTVWTTKAELRAVLTRSDAGLRSIPESPEPLPSRLPERTAFESDPESP